MLSSGDSAGNGGGCGCSVPRGRGGFASLLGVLLVGALGWRRRRV
jgi:hypothetical protein